MKYLKQATTVALLMTSTIYLTSCAQQETLISHPSEAMAETNNSEHIIAPVTIDAALNQTPEAIQLLVNQVLWINPSSQSKKWRVSLGRHDFAKVMIETYPDKTQHKMSFKTPGKFNLTIRSLDATNSQSGAAPNIMQQRITVIVKEQ